MKKKSKNKLFIYLSLAVFILLIFLHFLGFLNIPVSFVLDKFSAGQNSSFSFFTKLKYSFINFQEAQDLKNENQELQQQINQLLAENTQLLALKSENEQLRQILNFNKDSEHDYVMSKIVGKDINRSNTFIINKGKNDGIALDYPVIAGHGVIIGKIIEVRNNISVVLLLTDNLSQLGITKQDLNKSIGLAQGEFGLSIKAELIPQDIELNEDDIIISSGLEKIVPRGLIIGRISRITSTENDLFKSAIISPVLDYQELTVLSVIIPKIYQND